MGKNGKNLCGAKSLDLQKQMRNADLIGCNHYLTPIQIFLRSNLAQ